MEWQEEIRAFYHKSDGSLTKLGDGRLSDWTALSFRTGQFIVDDEVENKIVFDLRMLDLSPTVTNLYEEDVKEIEKVRFF